ncbi:MAG: hypothetical protein ACP6IU_04640 [Candidatus Asgardarchaeia archaeon]
MKYRLLMMRYESGDRVAVPPSPENFTSDNIIIVVDEFNKAVWLWFGAGTKMLFKRGAERVAHGLLGHGLDYGNIKVGVGCDNLYIIDEKNLDDSTVRSQFELLKSTLRKVKVIDGKLAEIESEEGVAVTPQPPPRPSIPSPPPKPAVETIPEKKVAPTAEVPAPKKAPAKVQKAVAVPEVKIEPSKISPDVKAGILIYAILSHFPEIYIAKHGNKLVVESEEGTLSIFKILKDSIELEPSYDFQGRQNKILETYNNLIQSLTK